VFGLLVGVFYASRQSGPDSFDGISFRSYFVRVLTFIYKLRRGSIMYSMHFFVPQGSFAVFKFM